MPRLVASLDRLYEKYSAEYPDLTFDWSPGQKPASRSKVVHHCCSCRALKETQYNCLLNFEGSCGIVCRGCASRARARALGYTVSLQLLEARILTRDNIKLSIAWANPSKPGRMQKVVYACPRCAEDKYTTYNDLMSGKGKGLAHMSCGVDLPMLGARIGKEHDVEFVCEWADRQSLKVRHPCIECSTLKVSRYAHLQRRAALRCLRCCGNKISRGEHLLREILTVGFSPFVIRKMPASEVRTRFGEFLEIDVAVLQNDELMLAFEYDGSFHDRPYKADEKRLARWRSVVARDRKKDQLFGSRLIRVHHSEFPTHDTTACVHVVSQKISATTLCTRWREPSGDDWYSPKVPAGPRKEDYLQLARALQITSGKQWIAARNAGEIGNEFCKHPWMQEGIGAAEFFGTERPPWPTKDEAITICRSRQIKTREDYYRQADLPTDYRRHYGGRIWHK